MNISLFILFFFFSNNQQNKKPIQWQTHKKVLLLYLLWRWMNAIIFLAVMVCSAIDVGRQGTQHEFHYEKWWIYLSHWTLLACTVQGWLAALICTKALMDNNRDFGKWAGAVCLT